MLHELLSSVSCLNHLSYRSLLTLIAIVDGFNTTIVDFDSSSSSAQIPYDFAGQGYIVLTNAYQGQELNDDK